MAVTTIPTAGIADDAVTTAKTSYSTSPFRNIIINGDMSIAQRGAGPSGAFASGQYIQGPDRYKIDISNMGNWKSAQSTDVPSGQGFNYSLKLDCDAADASPSAGDFIYLNQPIEGFNTASFKFGSSSAESLTLSFWVKSNKTGTYIVRFYDIDNQRALSQSYTISSASTWEKKTITISGDTVSGPNYDNGYAFAINWCLGAGTTYTSGTLNTSWNSLTSADQFVGQVNLADSTDNEWYITGVQLEVGTSASDFEFLPYDVNLQRCQRYFEMLVGTNGGVIGYGYGSGSDTARTMWQFKVQKRAVPSMSDSYSTSRQYRINFTSPDGTAVNQNSSNTPGFGDISVNNSGYMNLSGFSSIGGGHNGFMIYNNTTTAMGADAEL